MKDKQKIAVIGLGYVGLPLAVELAKKYDVVGLDTNENKVDKLRNGIDVTNEVGDKRLKKAALEISSNPVDIKEAEVYIVAVPTPINPDKTPNLEFLISACKTVAAYLESGNLVIFESTVYPGTTEEICVPVLEEYSGLVLNDDFKIGYSPERVNPGDKVRTLTKITKLVSGSDEAALNWSSEIYSSIITAGIYAVSSIKIAEAAKIIENSQRDLNIAFMNELAIIFNMMEIDTTEVIEAASTKWNFLKFKPGLVGGHCIGIDPYYFIYKAEQLGYHSEIITTGRKINDELSSFIVKNIIKETLKKCPLPLRRIGILGITFKENCADIRNSKVVDIIKELEEYGIEILVYDPHANADELKAEYGITLVEKDELNNLDSIVLAVAHGEFITEFHPKLLKSRLKTERKIVFDLKSLFTKEAFFSQGLTSWRL